jgi:hypothetical protein
MRLPKEKQVLYIEGVRQILIELSSRDQTADSRFSDSASAPAATLFQWLKMIESQLVISEAKAEQVSFGSSTGSTACRENTDCLSALRTCMTSFKAVTWDYGEKKYVCVENEELRKLGADGRGQRLTSRARAQIRQFEDTLLDPRFTSPKQPVAARSDSAPPENPLVISLGRRPQAHMSQAPALGNTKLTFDTAPAPPLPAKPERRQVSSEVNAATSAGSADSGKATSCAPVAETCQPRRAFRGKVFQGELDCVMAGMVSQLDTRNRKCRAVVDYDLGAEAAA